MDDDNIEKFGQAFFIEMLAYGIALKKDSYDITFLIEDIVNKVCVDHNFDAEVVDENKIRFYTSLGMPIIGLLYKDSRLVFTMPGVEPDLSMANHVTDILFSLCHLCSERNILEIRVTDEQKLNPVPTAAREEEDFKCDDDFLI